ncbi:hypothetical protein K440DRAFT_638488 [Wilcoxina mikolae CBS 423.85]|nr:hypothetical protein K440DRAFT_638488 [Wilcoxina mikolae CBS 423.85]
MESESHPTTGTTSLEISHTFTPVNMNMESRKLCRHWTNRFDLGSVAGFPPCELCIQEEAAVEVNEGIDTIVVKQGIVVNEGLVIKESVVVKEGVKGMNELNHEPMNLGLNGFESTNPEPTNLEPTNLEPANLEPTNHEPMDTLNTPYASPPNFRLPQLGFFEVLNPPKIAAQRATGRYHRAGTTFPDILSNSTTFLVHTWDLSSPPLHLHASMFHYYLLKLEVVNDTVTLPTPCYEAAGLLLGYFYNNGVMEKEVMGAEPLFVLMELAVLAARLKIGRLVKFLIPVLTERVRTAGVEELAKYTRVRLGLDDSTAKEGISGDRFPKAVECWLENGQRLKMAVTAAEGQEYLLEVMKEHPKFAFELLDSFMSMKQSRKRKKKVSFV